MGLVIPFRRKSQHLICPEELELLDRLRGSLQAMWRGGWAIPGETGGIALLRNQHCVGVWAYETPLFVYRAIESGEATMHADTVEAAYRHCLVVLGELKSFNQT